METNFFIENSLEKKHAIGLIHRVYLSQLKNSRKYLASTKTKSEIRGGGRKPWRQKGTGRARAGSTRSPLFVGGGVIFGPKPRTVFKKIKPERGKAILFDGRQFHSVTPPSRLPLRGVINALIELESWPD